MSTSKPCRLLASPCSLISRPPYDTYAALWERKEGENERERERGRESKGEGGRERKRGRGWEGEKGDKWGGVRKELKLLLCTSPDNYTCRIESFYGYIRLNLLITRFFTEKNN